MDAISTRGLANRGKIPKTVPDGKAFRLDEFLQRGQEGLKQIRGKRVVYLYHNRIGDKGDNRTTESYTFVDIHHTLSELARAAAKQDGTFEAKRILITADHGFLYQHSPDSRTSWQNKLAEPSSTRTASLRSGGT